MLTEIETVEILNQNRFFFWKCWLKSWFSKFWAEIETFFEIRDQYRDFFNFDAKISISGNILEKNRFQLIIVKISISVNIFEKISTRVQNLQKPRFCSTFSKRIRIRFKISKISISVNLFEKITTGVQNIQNLDFGQHFGKNQISVQNFENLDLNQHFRKKFN